MDKRICLIVVVSFLVLAVNCDFLGDIDPLEVYTVFHPKPRLNPNYQGITYNVHDATYKFCLNFNISGNCSTFRIEYFTEQMILDNRLSSSIYLPENASEDCIIIRSDRLNNIENATYFRVTAVRSNGEICSDDMSSKTFYRFLTTGIPTWPIPSSAPLQLPIPVDKCGLLKVIWPENINNDCYCLLSEGEYSFDDCSQSCGSQYKAHVIKNKVVLSNLQSSTDQFLVHFLCEENPCAMMGRKCNLESIVASYLILVDSEGPSCKKNLYIAVPTAGGVVVLIGIVAVTLCTCSCLCRRNNQPNYERVSSSD